MLMFDDRYALKFCVDHQILDELSQSRDHSTITQRQASNLYLRRFLKYNYRKN